MRYFPTRAVYLFAALAIVAGVGAVPVLAQNPITAAREAYRKAQEEAKRQREEAQRQKEQQGKQPAAAQPAAQPPPQKAPAQTTPAPITAPQAGSSQPVLLDDLLKPEAPVNVTIGDPKAMPDVIGVHLHMPLEEAAAILNKQYPKRISVPEVELRPTNMKAVHSLQIVAVRGGDDTGWVDVTLPPGKQIVWGVGHRAGGAEHTVNRAVLLAALREKYGKETFAYPGSNGTNEMRPAVNDSQIGEMWWLLDEQGRRAALPANRVPMVGCASTSGGANPGFLFWRGDPNPSPAPDTWIASSCVAVHARLTVDPSTDSQIIWEYTVDVVNVPLALRTAKVTNDWWKAEVERLRQQEIEKSKQAKPKL